ncbi:hypothetical protein [Amycolatopsis thermoflava]|uniref:hypothetical protein n=1 Tax=Amycolatopsis thermoflava TaxID=84480 RepID=UPI003F4A6907
MIVTVTPNPSLDHTVEVDALRRGEVLRVGPSRRLGWLAGLSAVQLTAAGSVEEWRPAVARVVTA